MRNSVGEAVFGSPTAPAGAGCKVGPDSGGSQKALTPWLISFRSSGAIAMARASERKRRQVAALHIGLVRYFTRWRSSSRWTLRTRVTPIVSVESV